jgi:hypothetical protein
MLPYPRRTMTLPSPPAHTPRKAVIGALTGEEADSLGLSGIGL